MYKQPHNNVRVLVCPLDWGLGHATRCIPIIQSLQGQGVSVCIAADGPAAELLKEEFPHLQHIAFRGYRIRFRNRVGIGLSLVLLFPSLLYRLIWEHTEINRLIKKHRIDVVISDNRYGLWTKKAYSVFITHQPNIVPPKPFTWGNSILRAVVRRVIRQYNACWIPDTATEPCLSGRLSHGYPLPSNTKFIGLLSRFSPENLDQSGDPMLVKDVVSQDSANKISENSYDVVAIVSGPEPYRTTFEKDLVKQLQELPLKSLLLTGTINASSGNSGDKQDALNQHDGISNTTGGSVTIVPHLHAKELLRVLIKGPIVICRSGYSTLMDLAFTGNRVICIPTPGQTEQEYLAASLAAKGLLIASTQHNFRLTDLIKQAGNSMGLTAKNTTESYQKAITGLLQSIDA